MGYNFMRAIFDMCIMFLCMSKNRRKKSTYTRDVVEYQPRTLHCEAASQRVNTIELITGTQIRNSSTIAKRAFNAIELSSSSFAVFSARSTNARSIATYSFRFTGLAPLRNFFTSLWTEIDTTYTRKSRYIYFFFNGNGTCK